MHNLDSGAHLTTIDFLNTFQSKNLPRVYLMNEHSTILARNGGRTCLTELEGLFPSPTSRRKEVALEKQESVASPSIYVSKKKDGLREFCRLLRKLFRNAHLYSLEAHKKNLLLPPSGYVAVLPILKLNDETIYDALPILCSKLRFFERNVVTNRFYGSSRDCFDFVLIPKDFRRSEQSCADLLTLCWLAKVFFVCMYVHHDK